MDHGEGDGRIEKEKQLERVPETAGSGKAGGERTADPRRRWLPLLFLLVIPAILSLSTLAVPFLPLPAEMKVWLVSGLLISTGVVFWGSALYFGREIASRYRRSFDPRNWFRKKRR